MHFFHFAVFAYLLPCLFSVSGSIDPCKACRNVAKTFLKGLQLTCKNNFEGGNTDWEEKRLPKYATSEIRYYDITDYVCKEDDVAIISERSECIDFFDTHESTIEEWYYKQQETVSNFEVWLCINKSDACCPAGKFGSQCKPCPMHDGLICADHGVCNGFATRSGTGKCECFTGYGGDLCTQCAANFYSAAAEDSSEVLCKSCDYGCKGGCTGPELKDCLGCASGYEFVEVQGCKDIDECAVENKCSSAEHEKCVNTAGNFICKCEDGYDRKGGKCSFGVTAEPIASLIFGLNAQRVLQYSALLGLSVCFLAILSRPSKLLWILLIFTIFLVFYVEFSSIAQYIVNLTNVEDDHLDMFLNQKHASKR